GRRRGSGYNGFGAWLPPVVTSSAQVILGRSLAFDIPTYLPEQIDRNLLSLNLQQGGLILQLAGGRRVVYVSRSRLPARAKRKHRPPHPNPAPSGPALEASNAVAVRARGRPCIASRISLMWLANSSWNKCFISSHRAPIFCKAMNVFRSLAHGL